MKSKLPPANLTLKFLSSVIALLCASNYASADEKSALDVYYKDQITHVVAKDIGLHLKPELRIQTRISTPFDGNPDSIAKLTADDTTNLEIQRARAKVGGSLTENLKVKFEYDVELPPHSRPGR